MPAYLELEVALRHVKPKVWRRFLVRNDVSFDALHEAIQDARGWWNSHLYGFFAYRPKQIDWRSQLARSPHEEAGWGDDQNAPNAAKVTLSTVLAQKDDKCVYIYDFGDSWEHDVKVVAVHELDEKFKRRLIEGARAFPLEDCGSYPGYEDLVANFDKPDKELDEDALQMRDWVHEMDPNWHPEHFDLEAAKKLFGKKR